MFQIYQARKLVKVIEARYGHTQPWVVLCEGTSGWTHLVVKVFTDSHLSEKPRVHGEFAGSWLAGEFDLLTPDIAWVEMDQDFINSLPPALELLLDYHDDRLKFGSNALGSFQHFTPGLKHSVFKKFLPVDRLFAFDNFIRNPDRGSHKPNLLLSDYQAYLIDHEYALDIDLSTIQQIKDSILPGRFSTTHIAYPLLSQGGSLEKASYFDDFGLFLRALNLNDLNSILVEVTNQGYQADIGMIMDYFRFIKLNQTIFVNLLKREIS